MNNIKSKTNAINRISQELQNDCFLYNLKNKAQIANFFYDNYLNTDNLSFDDHEFLIKSDRHDNGHTVIAQINFLVTHRFDLLDLYKLKGYGIHLSRELLQMEVSHV